MKRLFVLFLSICQCCFSVELPFLKFSHAVLSVETQKVYGQTDPDHYYSFPVLSHDPPHITQKAHIDHVKKRAKQHDGDILVIVDDCVGPWPP